MKTASCLSAVFFGATLALIPNPVIAQKSPAPETAIPREPKRPAGHGGFAPPRNAKPVPPPHGTVQAHPDRGKQANGTKKKSGGADASDGKTGAGTGSTDSR